MDHPTFQQGPSSRRPASPLDGQSPDIFDELARIPVSLREKEDPIFLPSYHSEVGATKAASRFNERLQHRLEVESGAADDLEYVGGGGLLLQRFAQFLRALAQFLQKARIFDGDDGLIGEVRDQFDLFVRERADFLAEHIDCADQLIVLAHWNGQYRPITAEFDGRDDKWIAIDVGLRSSDVGDLGHLLRGRDEAKGAMRRRVNDSRAGLGVGGWRVVHGHGAESLALAEVERAELGLAEPRRVRQYGLKHGLRVARRA